MSLRKASRIAISALTPNRPHHAQWMITRKCNYRCRGCNVWKEQDRRELATEEIKLGLNILKDLGIVEIVLSGGDPLLREDAAEIIEHASNLFITTVYDNGSMATKKMEAYENVDITNYFTQKGIPVWYCLYSFDQSQDVNQLFRIGKATDELIIRDKQAMVKLCDSLIEMKKKNNKILMTVKLLKALRNLFLESKRTWNCRALQNFFVIDHLGRVAGCHNHNFAASVFDLPKIWNSEKFNLLRKTYSECTQCAYLCYIFYSLHGSPYGNLTLAKDQWKNAKLLLKKNDAKPLSLVKLQ